MAKQKGIIKLEGTIGDITFSRTAAGYIAKGKPGVSAGRIATDQAFARARENMAEFGRAGKAAKLLRSAFRTVLQGNHDGYMHSRLVKQLVAVVKSDMTNDRGLRNVPDGNVRLLEGFDFNAAAQLGTSLAAPYVVNVNRAAGTLATSIASLVPKTEVTIPAGATHFRIISAGAAVDFAGETYVADQSYSAFLPWNDVPTGPVDLTVEVAQNSEHPIFLLLGIAFFQQVGGKYYVLNTRALSALSIVKVSNG